MELIIAAGGGGPINLWLSILTWVVFFALFAILYKFAFKPILGALDQREAKIKQASRKTVHIWKR